MKNIFRKIILFALVLFLSYLFAEQVGRFYAKYFHLYSGFGSFIASSMIYDFSDGVAPTYIFFLSLLFTAFGGRKKYWWIGIALIPAVLFEVYFDFSHIYFPIALGLLGWLLGWAVAKILPASVRA